MRDYRVNKPYEIGYLCRHIPGRKADYISTQDALVYIFRIEGVGYVAVVTSPVMVDPNHCRFFFEETPEEVIHTAVKETFTMFYGDSVGELFELPRQTYLEVRNKAVEIEAESGMLAALKKCERDGTKYHDYEHPILVLKSVKLVEGQKPQNPRDFGKIHQDAFSALNSLQLA